MALEYLLVSILSGKKSKFGVFNSSSRIPGAIADFGFTPAVAMLVM